jgi:tetratricopeptide (TPR) repeat protein
LGNKLSEGDNIDNLGGIAWVLGDYTLAIRQYRAALELRESIDDLWGVAISLSNLASTYRLQGAYEQALDYYQQSLKLYQQVGRKRGEAYVLCSQGQTLLKLGQLDEAWARLQDALTLRSELGDHNRLTETYAAIIHAAIARDDLPQAIFYCNIMLARLNAKDKASLRQEAYFAAFSLADYQGERDKAAHALALAFEAQAEMTAPLPQQTRHVFSKMSRSIEIWLKLPNATQRRRP